MKSFCIKTDNDLIINYLQEEFNNIQLDDIYYINKKFKIYKNIIIHYLGNNKSTFYHYLSKILTNCIIKYYEPLLLKKILNYNFFYFDSFEKSQILSTCYSNNLNEQLNCYDLVNYDFSHRESIIAPIIYEYISSNKSLILDGFVVFRLKNYTNLLSEIVDFAVNKYIIDKEYHEFIDLLKLYIHSKESRIDLVHLIYMNGESILLDNNNNYIPINKSISNSKYLSDISFSTNDYILNTLLSLIPQKIIIHIINYSDDFIDTLKLIFENKIQLCTNCNICKTYHILKNINKNIP